MTTFPSNNDIKVGDRVRIAPYRIATIPDEIHQRVGTVIQNDFRKYKYKVDFGSTQSRAHIYYFFDNELEKVN